MFNIVLAFISAFLVTFFATASIIHVGRKKLILDEPNERGAHSESTPSLGGIGIFSGVLLAIVLWTPFNHFDDMQYILAAFLIILLIGGRDDIIPLSPWKKLAGETLAALILVLASNVRVESLHGVFGFYELPFLVSVLFSVLSILLIINAFNLIDGINGLSASIALVISLIFGSWFFLTDHVALAIIAFALSGSLLAFTKYNFTPAQIFMGDTGALLLGTVCSILAIKFVQHNAQIPQSIYYFRSAPIMAIAVLILPLYDTLRVFTRRAFSGKSPFLPDKNHIHHMLLETGLSHMQSTGVLVFTNLFFIYLAYTLRYWDPILLLCLLSAMAIILSGLLYIYTKKKASGNES
jgi:UDP-N-acetylmuramyl pentapeptide phosphotransferase/UDP-N-acetylglucosamine-1-phosphate transferase